MTARPLPPVHNEIETRGRLLQWAVYDNPTDRPGKFVARAFACDQGPEPVPTLMFVEAEKLDDVRRALAARGLFLLSRRQAGDDAPIVEVWM